METDWILFLSGLIVFGAGLLRNTVFSEQTAAAGLAETKGRDPRHSLRRAMPEVLLFALVSAGAAMRADLRIVWTFAAGLFSLLFLVTVVFSFVPTDPPAGADDTGNGPDARQIASAASGRRRMSPFLIALLVLWFFSWRHLLR